MPKSNYNRATIFEGRMLSISGVSHTMKKIIMLVMALFIGSATVNVALATEININAELTQLTSSGASIEDAVKQLVAAHPDMAAAITTAAISMAPDHAVGIAVAAVDAAPGKAHDIQQAAIIAAPDQSNVITAALHNPAEDQQATAAGPGGNNGSPTLLASGPQTGTVFNSGHAGGGSGGGGSAVSP